MPLRQFLMRSPIGLKNTGLTGDEFRDHDDPAVWEFEGVVLVSGFAHIEPLKLCAPITTTEPNDTGWRKS